MESTKVLCSVSAEGAILSCPAKIEIAKGPDGLIFGGIIAWDGKKISDALDLGENSKLSENVSGYVDSLLPDCKPKELSFLWKEDKMYVSVADEGAIFRLAKISDEAAILFVFQIGKKSVPKAGETANLTDQLKKVMSLFGIKEFWFYAQTGSRWLLPEMKCGEIGNSAPVEIRKCKFFTYAQIEFPEGSPLGKGIRSLFDIERTELYLGADSDNFVGMISLPEIQTKYVKSTDMSMHMQFGKNLEFLLEGSFEFSMLQGIQFRLKCGVSNSAFELSAAAHMEKPFYLVDALSIGDTCLMFRIGKGIELGMYSTLYLNRIAIFGAVMLKETGPSFVPEMISAALINELTINSLLSALTGKDIKANADIDFIKIKGLNFQEMPPFDKEKIAERDVKYTAETFNHHVDCKALALDPEQIQLTNYKEGTDLADLKRTRHYFIDKDGNIQLSAQFYYASVNTRLGDYIVEQGLFFCGVLEILKARFEVLFSWRKSDECILAYARVEPINLGFLEIGSSGLSSKESGGIPIAENSVMAQFVDLRKEGMVFFLSASKSDVSFYFDGMVNILNMLKVQARILFVRGLISLDICTNLGSILKVSLHLRAAYQNFNSGAFQFCLIVDTTGLAEKMKNFTNRVNAAVRKLKDKIDNANRELTRAQNHVNELYSQIRSLDRKIDACKREISSASWWKKAFIAIGKGIEIGAYEVAKIGIYAAIGIATATLETARAVVNFAGKLGTCVLNAVNAVIRGAMSLFYINYVKLEIDADKQGTDFCAEMEVVLLGKTYTIRSNVKKSAISGSDPTGALERAINSDSQISNDIDKIEQAANRSNWRKYQHDEYTVEENKRNLREAVDQIEGSVFMMQSMQESYMEQFCVPMEEFDAMNLSMTDALAQTENILNTGTQASKLKELDETVEKLRKLADEPLEEMGRNGEQLSAVKESIEKYDKANDLYKEINLVMEKIQKSRTEALDYNQKLHDEEEQNRSLYVNPDGNLGKVVTAVEEQMYRTFPVDRSGSRLINISREQKIRESFEEAEKHLNIKPDQYVLDMRSRGRKGSYQNRL
ncbi:MAG: hypothetical protein NC429_07190 [Lachnospiraceae bacterium]|nr:hypothetical protein [Lachnospiraceae bacterium]